MPGMNDRIHALQNTDPQEILDMYCKNADDGLKKDVDKLYNEFSAIDTGVINALLLFILKMKQGYLPHYNYLYDSLIRWLNHISNTEEALQLITRKKRVTKSSRKQRQAVQEPDWMDDYMEELAALEA